MMRPYDWETADRTSRTLRIAAGIAIGLLVAYVLAVAFGTFTKAGAETRPYAGLPADQLPDVARIQFNGNGKASVAGVIPDGSGTWHAATFHVTHFDVEHWHDEQTVSDSVTLTAGPFDVTLECEPGAAQVDLWLEGQTEAYAAAVTLDCGDKIPGLATPDVPMPPGTSSGGGQPDIWAPAPPAAPDVSDELLSPAAADTSSEGKPATLNPPPGSVTASPAAPTVKVAGVSVERLPNTGGNSGLVAVGVALTLAGLVLLLVGQIRKGVRS